jgi:hypothetical protein
MIFSSARVAAMSMKQVTLIVTVVALIVVVTLVKVGLGGRDRDDTPPKTVPELAKPHLTFATTQGPPLQSNTGRPPDQEVKGEGHHDFWFTNDNDAPVEVFLTKVSCDACVSVKIGLAPEGLQQAQAAAAVGLGGLAALGGAAQAAAQTPAPGPDVAWTALEKEDSKSNGPKSFTVPPRAKGWARLGWKDQQAGPKLLTADLRTTSSVDRAQPIRLEVGARFVDPVQVLPANKEVAVETLLSGDPRPRSASVTVYSSTRRNFTLEPDPEEVQRARHPFVTCGPPRRLSDEECRAKEKENREKEKIDILCAYEVSVTVRERVNGREHDLGLFSTNIALKSDALAEPLSLTVSGVVRGPVTVVGGEGTAANRITFGSFPRSIGATRTVTVEADPGVKVEFDGKKKPDFLKVDLKEDEQGSSRRRTWSLTVSIPPNAVSGPFGGPSDPMGDTSIYLTANGRGVRIPVSGIAIQR